MRKSLGNQAVLGLELFVLATVIALAGSASAQKAEHYNSPLYAPRTYDPNVSVSNGLPSALQPVGIEQKLGEQLPLDAVFRDESGSEVKLGKYFSSGRPVVLAFVYYECPMLCNEVLNGLTGSLKGVSFDTGKEFDVVAISFDARENDKTELKKNKKAGYMERYARPGTENGWHFLTGSQESIDAVTKAAGFGYEWDDKSEQFAHAGAIMIATPEGKLSRYFYGIDYAPRDVKFGIMEASASKIGNPAEKLLLYCYHYDPSTGKYGLAILSVIRIAGVVTLVGLAGLMFVFWRRGKDKQEEQ